MAESTTDFEVFLDVESPEGVDEIEALYLAAKHPESHGAYDVTTRGAEQTFIKAGSGDLTLALVTDKARTEFLKRVQALTDDPGIDVEAWAAYHRSMAKDD